MQCLLRRPMLLTAIAALATGLACDSLGQDANNQPPINSIATSVGTPRCVRVSPTLMSDRNPAATWTFKAQRYTSNGSLEEITLTDIKNTSGFAELCVSAANYSDALLIIAQPSDSPSVLSRYLAPTYQNTIGDSSLEPLSVDLLTTHLSALISQVHQLPFSGFIGKISEDDFYRLETRLRLDSEISRDLRSGVLAESTTQRKWNLNVDLLGPVGRQLACLNSQMPSGSFSTDRDFSFVGSQPEALSETSNTTLKANGLLSEVAGASIENMTITINDVSLQGPVFTSIEHFGDNESGAFLRAPSFDSTGTLDARVTFTQLSDGAETPSLIPCVVGVITVQNNDTTSKSVAGESSVCFDVVKNGNLYVIPSDGDRGDWPASTTDFTVFGDDLGTTSFVLGVPGIHSKMQDDGLRITIDSNNVCMAFAQSHILSPSGEMADTASSLWYLCQVSDGGELDTSNRMMKASHSFEVGFRPATFSASLSRDDVAAAIGRSGFIHSSEVISFLKVDVRDSLVNFYQGEKANIVFTGKGIKQSYSAYLNGKGDPLGQITTGPQGQWMGALRIPSAKEGDFIRFKAPSNDQRPGAYFDVAVQENCDS